MPVSIYLFRVELIALEFIFKRFGVARIVLSLKSYNGQLDYHILYKFKDAFWQLRGGVYMSDKQILSLETK